MRAKQINEGLFDDDGNDKAIASWTKAFVTKDYDEYIFNVDKPFSIIVSEEDKNKLKFILNRYRVPHTIKSAVTESLKFNDGMEFDTSGPLRPEEREDGWYVIGKGYLIPVKDEDDANETIYRMTNMLPSIQSLLGR